MFQQTIQDILAVAEAGPRAEDILERVRVRIRAFEPFDSGELLAQTGQILSHFVLAKGLGEIGESALATLGDEPTLRVDTAENLRGAGLATGARLASLLILRVEVPGTLAAAIVLGHSRPWSFAGAPLSRIRTVAGVALRLLVSGSSPNRGSDEVSKLMAEVARLRTHVSSLEAEIIGLRADRATRRSGKPQ